MYEFHTPDQHAKLELLPELRRKLKELADVAVDLYYDDISSVSDAYKLYDVAGTIAMVDQMIEDDADLIQMIELSALMPYDQQRAIFDAEMNKNKGREENV